MSNTIDLAGQERGGHRRRPGHRPRHRRALSRLRRGGRDLGPRQGARRQDRRRAQSRGKVATVAVDVTNYAEVERARDDTVKALGRIDILVNNAGIAGPNVPTWEYPVEDWREVLSINLDGQFHCCRALVPLMIAQNYGRIVNIASIAGKEGNPNAPAYSRVQGRRHRADQVARQGARRLRHRGQLHHAGGGQDRDLRPDDAAAHRLHAVENPARPLRRGRGDRGARRLLRLGRLLVHDRRGVRHFRRAGDLLTDAAVQRRQRLTGIALMCGAVASFSCLDTTGKYLNHHMATTEVVWARYFFAFALTMLFSNPLKHPRPDADVASIHAGRALGAVAAVDGPELVCAALAAARRGAVDHFCDAVSGGAAVRAVARRACRLAPLDGDRRRILRRAGGGASGSRRPASGCVALAGRHRLLRVLRHLDARAVAHRQQRNHAVLHQPGRRGRR